MCGEAAGRAWRSPDGPGGAARDDRGDVRSARHEPRTPVGSRVARPRSGGRAVRRGRAREARRSRPERARRGRAAALAAAASAATSRISSPCCSGPARRWPSSAGMPELSVAIVVVIIVNAVFSFAQEYRAERAVEALKRILPQRVRVRRDGRPRSEIALEVLVPATSCCSPPVTACPPTPELLADVGLELDMSTLTGESRPMRRHVGPARPRDGVRRARPRLRGDARRRRHGRGPRHWPRG